MFARFADVIEGFLPPRRLSRSDLAPSALGTALVGRDGLRFRLGDRIDLAVERIDAPRGRVPLAPV